MKYQLFIFIDGCETLANKLEENELKTINSSIMEYIHKNGFNFKIELTRYYDSVALNVPSEFEPFTGKRIHLKSHDFHKELEIQFNYVDNFDWIHYCDDIWCDGDCGVLYCGCIDVCRCQY